MTISKTIYSTRKTDDYETPKPLYDLLNSIFRFELDPCSAQQLERQARIKTGLRFTVDNSGLTNDWFNYSTFVNPPCSQIKKWVDKCIMEFDERVKPDALTKPEPIVLLVPARTDTAWFHKIANHPYAKVIFLKGRLKFNNTKNSAPFPSCLIILAVSSFINQLDDELTTQELRMLASWTLKL